MAPLEIDNGFGRRQLLQDTHQHRAHFVRRFLELQSGSNTHVHADHFALDSDIGMFWEKTSFNCDPGSSKPRVSA